MSDVTIVKGKPTMVGPGFERIEQAMGASQPTTRHCRGAVEIELIGRPPRGHPRGVGSFPLLPVQPVGALPGVDAGGAVLQPPAGHAEPFECFRQFGVP